MLGSRPAPPCSEPARATEAQVEGRDVAVAQVLEAVVVGVVVLGATFVAVSFQSPPSPQANPGAEQTESATSSAVASLDELYIDDARYNHSALSKAIARAAAGEKGPLVDSVNAFLPSDASFCAYLNNGRHRMTLHCPHEPPGAAVGTSYPIEPNWRFHYAEPDLRYYDVESTTQLGLSEVPILNAHNVRDEGDYVDVTVQGTQSWKPGLDLVSSQASFTETAFSTLLQGDDGTGYPSASIYMECSRDGGHSPCYASDLVDLMAGYGPHGEGDDGKIVRFTVENQGPGNVPDGARLEIRFPVGLDVNRSISSPSGLTNVRFDGPDDSSPETLKADLDGPLSEGNTVSIDVEVNRTDTRYAYKQVDARLANGTVSSSQLLLRVQDKAAGTWTGGDTRVAMISTPKPAGSLDGKTNPEGRWGVVVPIPYGETTVENLTFEMIDDQDVLRSVSWPSDFDPPTGYDPRSGSLEKEGASSFRWENASGHVYDAYTFAEFQFQVETNGTQTAASERFPFAQPEASFQDYDPPPQSIQLQPGLWWRENPPVSGCTDCPGYNNDVDLGGDTATNEFDAEFSWRGIPLEGTSDYSLADLTDAERKGQKDALGATELSVEPRRLKPGETASVHIDAEDLAHYVAETSGITDMRLKSKIYAPWGVPDREPTYVLDHGRVAGNLEAPNDLLPLYIDGDNDQDVVTASTDGNVYGVDGETGNEMAGKVFGLPESSGGKPATPNLLSHGTDDSGGDLIAMGTKAGAENFYVIDSDFHERWSGLKPNAETKDVTTYGIEVGRDYVGSGGSPDGVPDILLSTPSKDSQFQTDYNWSRLTLWHGADQDGDDVGDKVAGWEDGIVITGTASKLGMGNVGVEAQDGLYANTGMSVVTNGERVVERSMDAATDTDITRVVEEVKSAQAGVSGAGLLGFTKGANEAFNLSGVRVLEAETVEEITGSSPYSGIALGDMDGWVWGTNASTPIYPVHGWDVANTRGYEEVSMGNSIEGYLVSSEGLMLYTPNAWTTYDYYMEGDQDQVWTPETGARAVDTPDGPYRSSQLSTSWWAGELGTIIRSTDRLDSIERKDALGTLAGTVDPEDPGVDSVLSTLETIDLTKINFEAVHAVSENEAWFVGGGNSSGTDGDGYIVHTVDGGDTLTVVEVDCDANCELNDITDSGGQLWVAGANGTLLARNDTGMATDVQVNGSASIDADGNLTIPLESDSEVKVKEATITWEPITKFQYGEAVYLGEGTSGDRDLWFKEKGCGGLLGDGYTEADTCSETWGIDHGNTMLVKDYVQSSDDNENRTLDGTGNLTLGPFTSDAISYEDGSWYEEDLNLPVTWHVNLTFDDGTSDAYTVKKNSTGIYTVESSIVEWTTPSNLDPSFSTPACLGGTASDCPTLKSVNVTNLGTSASPNYVGVISANVTPGGKGTSLYGLAEGTRTWSSISLPISTDLNDAAVNPHDPDRWVAVGWSGRTLISYDGGENWTSLPESAEHLRSIDHTHPDTPALVGGVGVGERFSLNGYIQNGYEDTQDLFDKSNHPIGEVERVNITDPPTTHADSGGGTPTEIKVWDEHADAGDGAWKVVFNASEGPRAVDLAAPTERVELRFHLGADISRHLSPMMRGSFTVGLWDDAGETGDPDTTIEFDLKQDGDKFSGTVDRLDYNQEHGYLRLDSVRNPWLYQLGNEDAGDWAAARNLTGMDVGARTADLALADNGSTIWVVTEGIYEHGAEPEQEPVMSVECSDTGSSLAVCYDSTLYAINASTGKPHTWWDPVHFSKVPQKLAVADDEVTVAVGNATEQVTVYWMEASNPTKSTSATYNDWEKAPKAMIVADAFPQASGTASPILAMKHLSGSEGELSAYEAGTMHEKWTGMPALSDEFRFNYEVPEDALYGTRIVMTEVRWNVTDTFDTELVQSARLHDVFEATPDGERMPLVPTYTMEVVAWIDDWR